MGGDRGPRSRGTLPSTCCQASLDAAPASIDGGSGLASWSAGGPPGLGLGLLCHQPQANMGWAGGA